MAIVYVCDLCGTSLINKRTPIRHILNHTGDTSFVYGEIATEKAIHIKQSGTHTDQKPLIETCIRENCINVCNQPRGKLYSCETCHNSFLWKGNLTRHQLIHTGNRNHICEFCGRSFTYKYNLTRHLLIHYGDKPYKCEICEKAFSEKKNLSRHMLIHNGESAFICGICIKSFKEKNNLTRHMHVHSK